MYSNFCGYIKFIITKQTWEMLSWNVTYYKYYKYTTLNLLNRLFVHTNTISFAKEAQKKQELRAEKNAIQ